MKTRQLRGEGNEIIHPPCEDMVKHCKNSVVAGLHFFKVFLPHLSSLQLKIPETFIKNFKGLVPQKITLKDTLGRSWHVEIQKVEDDFFLKNGWQEFVKDHSLKVGEFLVFGYKNDSSLEVQIFDESGCEKELSLADRDIHYKSTMAVKVEHESEAREVFSRPTPDFKQEYCRENLKLNGKSDCSRYIRLERNDKGNAEKELVPKPSCSSLVPRPHFTWRFMQEKRYHMLIPKGLVKNCNVKLTSEMILRDQSKNKWPVRITSWKDGCMALSRGWANFCNSNNLTDGDRCVLEFPKGRGRGRGSNIIDVNIIRKRRSVKTTVSK